MPLTESVLTAFSESALLWGLLALFIGSTIVRSARFKGFVGELRIRFATDFRLSGKTYHPLHNLTLTTPDGTTQIDHIVVSRFGVFVIETKNLKGWIFGDAKSKRWTQTIFGNKYQFQNPLHQNYKHLKAVESLLQPKPGCLHSVVVFVGSSRFKTFVPPNVLKLRGFLRYIRSKSDVRLSDREVASYVRALKKARLSRFGTRRAHVRNLKKNRRSPTCPKCGESMVLRTAKKGPNAGGQFWGCSGFPKCRFVRDAT